jgi:hypothetical protein
LSKDNFSASKQGGLSLAKECHDGIENDIRDYYHSIENFCSVFHKIDLKIFKGFGEINNEKQHTNILPRARNVFNRRHEAWFHTRGVDTVLMIGYPDYRQQWFIGNYT